MLETPVELLVVLLVLFIVVANRYDAAQKELNLIHSKDWSYRRWPMWLAGVVFALLWMVLRTKVGV